MIRPLMLLIIHLQPDHLTVRILRSHHAALNTREYPTVLHAMLVKPCRPLLQLLV
jgi:hypothetical protein